MIDDDHMDNLFVSKRINKNVLNNEIYFGTEALKSQRNNETFNAKLELDHLSEMAQQMLDVHDSDLEFITQKMQSFLGNLGFNQPKNQLDQNFCLDNKDDPKKSW